MPKPQPERTVPPGPEGTLDPKGLENLLAVLGGETNHMIELIDSFLEDAPRQLTELERALAAADAAGVRRIAHTLKSNSADFGAMTLADLCRRLEEQAKSNRLEGDAELSKQVLEEFAKVRSALRAVRDGRRNHADS